MLINNLKIILRNNIYDKSATFIKCSEKNMTEVLRFMFSFGNHERIICGALPFAFCTIKISTLIQFLKII